jgi:pSer/pThr/pTyr-binding forkhead associated (FHA) protein
MLVPIGAHQGQPPLSLGRLFTMIGSAPSARLYLPSKQVSRCHAVVINADTGLFVRDLASRAELQVNGRAVKEADLRDGDVLQVGPFVFRFTDRTDRRARPPALPVPTAFLEVEGLDDPLPLDGRTTLFGRRETADVSLTENAASSAHALIFVAEGKHLLRDLNSRTGTFVNGVKVHEHVLSPGDVLRIGETTFRYVRTVGRKRDEQRAVTAPATAATAAAPAPAAAAPVEEPPVAQDTADAVETAIEGPIPVAGSIAVEPKVPEEPSIEPAAPSDFGFAPIEVVPEIEPSAVSTSSEAEMVPDRMPDREQVGLLEAGETAQESEEEPMKASDDRGDHPTTISLADVDAEDQVDEKPAAASVEPTAVRTDVIELAPPQPERVPEPEPEPRVEEAAAAPPPEPPMKPVTAARLVPADAPPPRATAPAAKPARGPARTPARTPGKSVPPPARAPEKQKPAAAAQPAAQQKQWNKPPAPVRGQPPSAAQRPPRPQSPFDVLAEADELEPLPDLPPEPAPPAAGNAPDSAAGRST